MTTPEQPAGKTPERARRGAKKQLPEPPVDTDKITEVISGSVRTKLERLDETEKETESRLRIAEEDSKAERNEKKAAMDHRRRVEIIALCAYLVICAVVGGACLWILSDKSIAPQDKAWVGPTLTLIIGGVAGYLTGRSSGRPPEK